LSYFELQISLKFIIIYVIINVWLYFTIDAHGWVRQAQKERREKDAHSRFGQTQNSKNWETNEGYGYL